jgi:hypothetical protein
MYVWFDVNQTFVIVCSSEQAWNSERKIIIAVFQSYCPALMHVIIYVTTEGLKSV